MHARILHVLSACSTRDHPTEWSSKGVWKEYVEAECDNDDQCEWAANAKFYVKSDEKKCCEELCKSESECEA